MNTFDVYQYLWPNDSTNRKFFARRAPEETTHHQLEDKAHERWGLFICVSDNSKFEVELQIVKRCIRVCEQNQWQNLEVRRFCSEF